MRWQRGIWALWHDACCLPGAAISAAGLSPHSPPASMLPAPAHPCAAVRQARRKGEQVALALQRFLQLLNVLPAQCSEGQWIRGFRGPVTMG